MPVLDIDQTGGNACPEPALGGLRHRRAGFSGADHEYVAELGVFFFAEPPLDRGRRIGGIEGRAEYREGVAAPKLAGHRKIGCAKIAAAVSSGSSVVMGMRTSASPYCSRRESYSARNCAGSRASGR